MLQYLARRLAYALVTLILVSILGFIVIDLPPGTYLDVYMMQLEAQGTSTANQQIESLRRQYGIDDPAYVQYWKWITGFVRGDFGESFEFNRDVRDLIGERLLVTVILSVAALLLTWMIAIPLGVYSATHQYSGLDHVFTLLGLGGLSIPNFTLALVLMVILARVFGQEVGGLFSQAYADAPWSLSKIVDLLKHVWVALVVMAAEGTAGLMRIMRGNLLDILNMPYVQAARARGLSEPAVIVKHAVRNAIQPLIMLLGTSLPGLISGATVISMVLSLPTVGPIYFNALLHKDMYLAVTFLMFLSFMLILGNLVADLLLAWVDPRIQLE